MIRHAKFRDIPQLKEIWSEAFGEEDYAEDFYSRIFRPEDTLCEAENETVLAMLHKIPCRIDQGQGGYENAYYFFALATRSGARGRGIMGQLIERAGEEIRAQGAEIVFLIPAQESLKGYYKRFGFVPLKNLPVFETRCTRDAEYRQKSTDSCIKAEPVSIEEAVVFMKSGKWKFTNRNVYFPWSVENFCLDWVLKEEKAVFYKVVCRGREVGFLLGKREGNILQVSVYGLDYPCWLQIGEALSETEITAIRIPAQHNPCEIYFRELNENGGYPVSIRGGEGTELLHGLIPI